MNETEQFFFFTKKGNPNATSDQAKATVLN